MDRVWRVLRPYRPLEIVSDAPPDDMVRAFLTAHWEHRSSAATAVVNAREAGVARFRHLQTQLSHAGRE
jgi:hypothetical protein